jgi:DNA-binding transcriptional regulator YdaS (Cro superfamily)
MKFRKHVERAVVIMGSQQKLADACGVSQQQISYLLNDAEGISGEMALKIANATENKVTLGEMRPDLAPAETLRVSA